MDMFDFAGLLFGGNRNRTEATTVTATGAAASDGGVAGITLDADVTPAEDVGEDADQTIIDLPTSPDVDEGDEVIVTLVGDGPLKTPIVTANPGSGDRMRALANSAKTIANAAQEVAQAVNQHFFTDTNGIHVTEATQEDWNTNHSGANVLINSIGQLFRDGLNNLLTLTTENGARALTIWDGLGNAASNILARFSSDGISFADGTSFDIGDSSSYIHFDGNGHINIGGSGLTVGGYIPTGGVTVSDLTQAAQDATLNSNISVGGRNLLKDSDTLGDSWAKDVKTAVSVANGVATLTRPTSSTICRIYQMPANGYWSWTTGESYVASIEARSDTDGCPMLINAVGAGSGLTKTVNVTTEWKRYYYVLTSTNGGTGSMSFCNNGAAGDVMQMRRPKLEAGNKATDWTPAPEDIETRVSSAESAITQNANNIALKVSETDVTGNYIVGKINLDSTTASIAAQHINLQGAVTISDLASDAQNATLNSNVQVGGRNLVWDTAWNDVANRWTAWGSPTTREIVEIDGKRWLHLVTTTTKFQGYQQGSFRRAGYGEIQAGDTLTISFMAYATVAASDISCIGVHWNKSDGSIYGQTWITTDLTTVPKRFVKTVSIADGAPVVGFNIMVGDNSAVARELWISEVKLEKGNKATDWTPAPEDVDSAISNASKTATSYVTEITGQNGIMVHPSTDDDTGVRITSDVDIRQDNVSIANFGALDSNNNPTARVGKVDDYHMSIDQDSLDMYDGTHKIASYSASVSSVDDGGVHNITVSETSIHVEPNPDYVAPSQDDPYAGTYDQPPSAGSLVVRGETRIAETTSADDEYESYIGMLAHSRCVNSDSGNVISAGVSVSTSGVMDSTGVRSTIDSKVSLSGNKLQLSREGKTGSGTSVTLDMYQVMQMLTTASANLTRGSAVSSWSSGTVMRSGKVVTLTINGLKLTSALASGSTSGSITTIPTDYRPSVLQRTTACIGTTGNYANVWFVASTTGNVAMANRSSLQIPTTAEISLQITYIID